MLSSEYGTSLTGRHLDLEIYPLSFKEFLSFNSISVADNLDYVSKRDTLKNLFNEYLTYGGFPKVVLEKENKKELLKTYFEDILFKDIINKYKVRESEKLSTLAYYYLSNISSAHTINSISKFIPLSNDTLDRFSQYLNQAYLLFFVPKFSTSLKEQAINAKKVYAIDTGLKNMAGFKHNEDFGKLLENLVFLELKRQKKEIYYWKDRYDYEVDFVIKQGLKPSNLIQVCWDLSNEKVKQRETRSLERAMEEYKLNEGTIITQDYEGEENIGGKKILYKSAVKWFLGI